MKVKICGVRRPEDVAACLDAGADLVGLNFVPSSKRALDMGQGARLAGLLPPDVGVAVFQDADEAEVLETLAMTGLKCAQLHGDVSFSLWAALEGWVHVIRALPGGAHEQAEREGAHVDAFLLDGPRPGSGQAWAWEGVGPELFGKPVFLAGGLDPTNVAAAIRTVRPAGVDVASGVEGPDGSMDAGRVAAFVQAARAAQETA